MEAHEYANLFPMMTKQELEQLCEGMRQNGYDKTSPIILHNGKILDGRNRQLAADTVGLIPEYVVFSGDNPLSFVISHNLHRRHLNETQRAGVAAKLANMKQGDNQYKSGSANLQTQVSIPKAAGMLNTSPRTVATYKSVAASAPELVEKMDNGELTAHEAEKKVKEKKKEEAKREVYAAGVVSSASERWAIYQGDINNWKAPRRYDFIITDPPYPREFLPLWEALAKRAAEWLKPGGLLIAMSGHSYLNEIYPMMDKNLTYWWTGAYLTPGGQSAQVFPRKVLPSWKPLLIYCNGTYSGKWFGDVAKSPVNNNEKDLHEWGQSAGGMEDIIGRFAEPGSYILDPFCGSGTTGVSSLKLGCFFDGLDISEEHVNISKGRLSKCQM